MTAHSGMDLRRALDLARQLGVKAEAVRRKGEIRFSVPGRPSVKQDARRKDATRAVTTFLKQVEQERKGLG